METWEAPILQAVMPLGCDACAFRIQWSLSSSGIPERPVCRQYRCVPLEVTTLYATEGRQTPPALQPAVLWPRGDVEGNCGSTSRETPTRYLDRVRGRGYRPSPHGG